MRSLATTVLALALAAGPASACASFDSATAGNDGGGGDGGSTASDLCAGADYCETFTTREIFDDLTIGTGVTLDGDSRDMSLVGDVGQPSRALQIAAQPVPGEFYGQRFTFGRAGLPPKVTLRFDLLAEAGGYSVGGIDMTTPGSSSIDFVRLTLLGNRDLLVDRIGFDPEKVDTLSAGVHTIAIELDTATKLLTVSVDGAAKRKLQGTAVPDVATAGTSVWFGLFTNASGAEPGRFVYDNVAIRLK